MKALRTSQGQAVHRIVHQPARMLAWDMASGKSAVVVEVINRSKPGVHLICAPIGAAMSWPNHFAEWGNGNAIVELLVSGTNAKRAERAKRAIVKAKRRNAPAVIITNYESVWRPAMAAMIDKIPQLRSVTADESHRIKSPSAKASWFFARIRNKAQRRIALTGTPFHHSPLDIYGQFRFLDPTIYGRSFVRFRNMYAVMSTGTPSFVVGFRNLDDLHERFYRIAERLTLDDVADVPPVTMTELTGELDSRSRRIYDDLERDFVADVQTGVISASNALVKMLRLSELANGFATVERSDGIEVRENLHTGKAALLAEAIDDLGMESAVVFTRFTADLKLVKAVASEARCEYYELSGAVKNHQAFCRSEKRAVLGVQIRAGGEGVDGLQHKCRTGIFWTIGQSLGDYKQAIGRIRRPGQTEKTRIIHLIMDRTVDVVALRAFQKGQEIVEAILDDARARPCGRAQRG